MNVDGFGKVLACSMGLEYVGCSDSLATKRWVVTFGGHLFRRSGVKVNIDAVTEVHDGSADELAKVIHNELAWCKNRANDDSVYSYVSINEDGYVLLGN
jgi:hypothetical protein